MGQKADKPIEYEQPPVATAYAIRRGFRLLILFTLINTVLLALNVGNGQGFLFVQKQWAQWRQAREAAKLKRQQLAQQQQLAQHLLALQQQCVGYAAPPGQVVYDENPERAAKLIADAGGGHERLVAVNGSNSGRALLPPPRWQPPARAKLPAPYLAAAREFLGYSANVPSLNTARAGGGGFGGSSSALRSSEGALLFMHGRTAPSGASRLVVVRLATSHLFSESLPGRTTSRSPSASSPPDATLRPVPSEPVHVYSLAVERVLVADAWASNVPGTPWNMSFQTTHLPLLLPDATRREVLRLREPVAEADIPPLPPGNQMRFFAGQADPADESHFTLDYELDGRPGTIDGYLGDAGVVLKPRAGRSVYVGRQNAWELAPPASGSTTAPDKSGG